MKKAGTVERAFELAQSGKYQSVQDIRVQLKAEGYSAVLEHLSGSTIRRQLKSAIETATSPVSDTALT